MDDRGLGSTVLRKVEVYFSLVFGWEERMTMTRRMAFIFRIDKGNEGAFFSFVIFYLLYMATP